ncbi:MAG: hypothetical protein ACD_39C00686G0003 [uncultured bacterium]|nr:MAG: hypothetical protein ACD_39C00686G0003 [uncultured bacterium]
MHKYLKTLALVMFFAGLVSVVQAATYGYMVVRGKDQTMIEREISTIERLIKTWPNGEVLYVHTVKAGAMFFKRITATIFYAGNRTDISNFLTQGPYEGDYLRDITVSFSYSSLRDKNGYDGEINTTFTRKFTNIRKAIETIEGKDAEILWNELKDSKASAYKKHLVSNELIAPRVSIVFYSMQPTEDNRLLGISFTDNKVTNSRE